MIPCPSCHPEPGKLPVNWHVGSKLPKRLELLVIFSHHAHSLAWSSAVDVSWENTIVLITVVDVIDIVLSQQK